MSDNPTIPVIRTSTLRRPAEMTLNEHEIYMDELVHRIYWAMEHGRIREAKQLIADEVRRAIIEEQSVQAGLRTETASPDGV